MEPWCLLSQARSRTWANDDADRSGPSRFTKPIEEVGLAGTGERARAVACCRLQVFARGDDAGSTGANGSERGGWACECECDEGHGGKRRHDDGRDHGDGDGHGAERVNRAMK